MTELRTEVAHEIMALIDEYPSEPFSFERKILEQKIEDLFARYTQQADDELDMSFQLGYDEGQEQTRRELEDQITRYESEIRDLENNLEDVKQDAYNDGFTEGFETARTQFDVS